MPWQGVDSGAKASLIILHYMTKEPVRVFLILFRFFRSVAKSEKRVFLRVKL